YLFNVDNVDLQVASAIEQNAYPGTTIHRTMAMIKDSSYNKPIILDIVRVDSDSLHQYDLPFFYMGQLMHLDTEYETDTILRPIGSNHGYQHIYQEGIGTTQDKQARLNWLNNNKFYTYTMFSDDNESILMG